MPFNMERRYLNIIQFFVLYHIVIAQLKEGDKCTSYNNPGVCKLINDCPSGLELLKNNINLTSCSFQNNISLICCETNRDHFRTSDLKCRQYGIQLNHLRKRGRLEVFGGTDAVNGAYPHMAGLGYGTKDNMEWNCGGSLISEKFILTAAHCLNHRILGPVSQIRVGDVNLDGADGIHKDYEVINRIPHPEYRPPSVYNDIALLELSQPVEFTKYIKPACLYTNSNTSNLRTVTATGWGLTNFGGVQSSILQEVLLNLFSLEECNKVFTKNRRKLLNGIMDHQQICYGGRNEEKDTCEGDSGGPIQVQNSENSLLSIVGITSVGKACGTANIPAVYIRVSNYIPWIESIVWP